MTQLVTSFGTNQLAKQVLRRSQLIFWQCMPWENRLNQHQLNCCRKWLVSSWNMSWVPDLTWSVIRSVIPSSVTTWSRYLQRLGGNSCPGQGIGCIWQSVTKTTIYIQMNARKVLQSRLHLISALEKIKHRRQIIELSCRDVSISATSSRIKCDDAPIMNRSRIFATLLRRELKSRVLSTIVGRIFVDHVLIKNYQVSCVDFKISCHVFCNLVSPSCSGPLIMKVCECRHDVIFHFPLE